MSILRGSIDRLAALKDRVTLQESYQEVFGTPTGQLVLRHIMKVGHLLEPTFLAGDPHATSFREGQRQLALSIMRLYCRDTTQLIKQIEEGLTNDPNT